MTARGKPFGQDEPLVVEFVDAEDPAAVSAQTSASCQPAACPDRFSKENRRRLSGAGLRTFVRIADLWELSPRQRRLILGSPAASTYRGWLAAAAAHRDLTLPVDVLIRISAVLGIHAMLGIIYLDAGQPLAWLQAPCPAMPFGGRTPMEVMTDGSFAGVMAVRGYIDAAIPWNAAAAGHGRHRVFR